MDVSVRDAIVREVRDRFSGDSGGHDIEHTFRVVRNAMHISSIEGGDADVIELAALLHDTDDRKLFGDTHGECPFARSVMENRFSDDTIEHVVSIINSVSFKGRDTRAPDTLEGRIVQDADRLDAIGAVGIARAFAYGGSRGRRMYDPSDRPRTDMDAETYFSNTGTTINHFYEKLLLLKDMMNTDTGRSMAERRHTFMESFLDEFYREWDGEQVPKRRSGVLSDVQGK
ncbi:MAG: HD domain-containing protein [Candidatus Methanomethylophilaceae archaeon]|nr:HD domain-containing protein [Candidatus Methanomethylophilaceae archaeon]MDY5872550.1 HD domain-containing protein [Candidatus Methanomethylophilaceae archaeon]